MTKPFLYWLITNLRSSNTLSAKELQEWNELQSSGQILEVRSPQPVDYLRLTVELPELTDAVGNFGSIEALRGVEDVAEARSVLIDILKRRPDC